MSVELPPTDLEPIYLPERATAQEDSWDLSHALSAHPGRLVTDPGPPYLGIDLYPLDFDDPKTPRVLESPPWDRLLGDPRVFYVWLKGMDGTSWLFSQWAIDNWRAIERLVGDRLGQSFLLGLYSFLQLTRDGALQAERLWQVMLGCGWTEGRDKLPCGDVESGGPSHPNRTASRGQVIDCASAFAERMTQLCGRRPILYGRGMMRDLGITSKMGFDRCSNASYTRLMQTRGYVPPFALDEIVEWQYGGDGVGDAAVHGLPLKIDGHGIDLAVAIEGARRPTLESTIRRLTGGAL